VLKDDLIFPHGRFLEPRSYAWDCFYLPLVDREGNKKLDRGLPSFPRFIEEVREREKGGEFQMKKERENLKNLVKAIYFTFMFWFILILLNENPIAGILCIIIIVIFFLSKRGGKDRKASSLR